MSISGNLFQDTIVDHLELVARHFQKSLRTVQRWLRNGMPKLSGNRFDLVQIEEWLAAKDGIVKPYPGPPSTSRPDDSGLSEEENNDGKDYWDKESKKYQAKARELEYRKRLGELVEKRDLESLLTSRIMAVRQGLLSLSRALPPQLAACKNEREMEPIIAKSVHNLLEAFSRPLPEEIGGRGEIIPNACN
jgi:phage terminase Nu1 subunit (DNA packaging protein)